MNKITAWLLKRICRKLVIQGPTHKGNIVKYFKIMMCAASNEFTEDSPLSLNAFMKECFEESLVDKLR